MDSPLEDVAMVGDDTRALDGYESGRVPAGQPDRIARERDRDKNRRAASFPRSHPLVENLPVEETPLGKVMAVIGVKLPAWASYLSFGHNHVRLQAQKMSREVAMREERLQQQANVRAEQHNGHVRERIAAVRQSAASDAERLRQQLRESIDLLDAAGAAAPERLAAIGAPYDPNDLSELAAVRPSGLTARGVAVSLGLPTPGGANWGFMPTWMGYFCSGVVGLNIGISLLVTAHVLHPDTIARHPVMTGLGMVVGFGIALCGKYAVRLCWLRVGQYYVVPRPPIRWLRAIVVAVAETAAVLASDMALEARGLLALSNLQNRMDALGGTRASQNPDADTVLFLCVAFVVTGGYVFYAALEGYLKGRDAEVIGRVAGHAEEAERVLDASQRSAQPVRAAQNALSDVRYLRHRVAAIETRLAEGAQATELSIAALEASLIPVDASLSEEGKLLVQDAVDEARAAGIDLTEKLEAALAAVEPLPEVRRGASLMSRLRNRR